MSNEALAAVLHSPPGSAHSLDFPKTICSTASSLPPPAELEPNPRAVRVALLRAAVGEWEDRILAQRRSRAAGPSPADPSATSPDLFRQQFSDCRARLRGFRGSYLARNAQLTGQAAVLAREVTRRADELVSLEKRLLLVSLEFARAKKEAGGRGRRGLLERLFG